MGEQVEQGEFSYASQAQLLRAHQRDTSQITRLTDLVSELVRAAFGTRTLQDVQSSLSTATSTVYYLLTFGLGSQTLGEEYVDIQPYAESSRNFPTRTRRIIVVLLHLLPPLLLRKSSKLQKVFTLLPAFHLALFLLRGRYHSLAKRITGTRYITTDRNAARMASFEPLGVLVLIPLIVSLLPSRSRTSSAQSPQVASTTTATLAGSAASPQELEQLQNPQISALSSTNPQQCTLCLDPRGTQKGTALTECGHGFCWGCLSGLEKMECPLCRQALRMERLISVRNL